MVAAGARGVTVHRFVGDAEAAPGRQAVELPAGGLPEGPAVVGSGRRDLATGAPVAAPSPENSRNACRARGA